MLLRMTIRIFQIRRPYWIKKKSLPKIQSISHAQQNINCEKIKVRLGMYQANFQYKY
jgi:hypothetical protein